jgi:hypothetical protein
MTTQQSHNAGPSHKSVEAGVTPSSACSAPSSSMAASRPASTGAQRDRKPDSFRSISGCSSSSPASSIFGTRCARTTAACSPNGASCARFRHRARHRRRRAAGPRRPNGVAILLPLTFSMDPTSAIILLSCIYWGALFGGAITSILFNIPGEAWSVATTFDGYPMAQQGKAGEALTAPSPPPSSARCSASS